MTIDDRLRNLAKSVYWQSLYNASLNTANVNIFNNMTDFSGLQVCFLYWLSVYKMLNDELATYEDKRLTKNVLLDNYRVDAYLVYRGKKNEFLWKKHRQEEKEAKIKSGRKKAWKNPGKESTISVDLRRE